MCIRDSAQLRPTQRIVEPGSDVASDTGQTAEFRRFRRHLFSIFEVRATRMTAIARRACVLITLLTILGLASNLQAQTNPIYFPYVTNNTQTSTEIILTNASGRDANVNLVAYRDDGDVVGEVAVVISARSQVVVGPGTFPGLQGWV